MSELKQSKGLYALQKISIITPDDKEHEVTSAVMSIEYNEDLFEGAFSHGFAVVIDTNDLIRTIPVIGEERLVFQYKISNSSDVIVKKFRIYKVVHHVGDIQAQQNYALHFIAEEAMHNSNVLISRSYKDKSVKVIVEDLFSEINETTDTDIFISDTKGNHHFVIPNIHPVEAINLVGSMCQHESYKSGLFLFYQNYYGFNFKCLEELYSGKSLGTFRRNIGKASGVLEKEASLETMDIISPQPDTLKVMWSGMYANSYECYDPVVKAYRRKEFVYKDNFEDQNHLNKFKLSTDDPKFSSPDQRYTFAPSNSIRRESTYITNSGASLSHCNDIEEFAHYGISKAAQINAKQYKITLKGDDVPSLKENQPRPMTVGEVIEIEHNTKSMDKERHNNPHNYLSGKYLVVQCKHVFTARAYMIEAKVVSDSNVSEHEEGEVL